MSSETINEDCLIHTLYTHPDEILYEMVSVSIASNIWHGDNESFTASFFTYRQNLQPIRGVEENREEKEELPNGLF